jgi:hypothetical protein
MLCQDLPRIIAPCEREAGNLRLKAKSVRGGPGRGRTAYLIIANDAFSQLNFGPETGSFKYKKELAPPFVPRKARDYGRVVYYYNF